MPQGSRATDRALAWLKALHYLQKPDDATFLDSRLFHRVNVHAERNTSRDMWHPVSPNAYPCIYTIEAELCVYGRRGPIYEWPYIVLESFWTELEPGSHVALNIVDLQQSCDAPYSEHLTRLTFRGTLP